MVCVLSLTGQMGKLQIILNGNGSTVAQSVCLMYKNAHSILEYIALKGTQIHHKNGF